MREFIRNNWDETSRSDALALLKRSNHSSTAWLQTWRAVFDAASLAKG
jgi:hypothetical protein